MENNIAIKVNGISKDFILSHEKNTLFTHHITNTLLRRVRYETLHVLKDISFTVQKGEVVGIIGNNGAGKTTLLKIIAGIIKPTTGTVTTTGKLVPFLGLGVGFSPELTAVDNIILYGIILGIQKKEIISKVPEVLKYAELEKFADTKIANFSSGMQARLAFSTAIQVDPDILIVDEVLAVGDASFRKKSRQSFGELVRRNKTILIVTHNLDQIQELSDRAIWLDEGRIRSIGEPEEVVRQYLAVQNPTAGRDRLGRGRSRESSEGFEFY